MTLASMTGFARAAAQDDGAAWTWEVKSVNGKGLDVRCRVPPGLDALEPIARAAVAERFARGNFAVNLGLQRVAAAADYRVNRDLLAQVLALKAELGDAVAEGPPRLAELLAIRGLVEPADEEETEDAVAARRAAMVASLAEALDALAEMRVTEGGRLSGVLNRQLDEIADLTERAATSAAAQPEALRARLAELMRELMETEPALPEERLAQEAALLVGKADVREELDRLVAHEAAARALLEEGGAVGRRLDFLCQELNREANTLCSKAADVELTRIGLSLKAAIEQFREQVQNIE